MTPECQQTITERYRSAAVPHWLSTNDWSKVVLRVMLDAAQDAGVVFNPIRDTNAELKLRPELVAFSSLIGTLILIPVFGLHVAFSPDYRGAVYSISPLVIAGILFLIIFPSWLSYLFWNKGVSLIGTTRSEIYTHLIPLSGGLMGILFLGNALKSYHLVTLVLIVSGIVCCSVRNETIPVTVK